MIYTNDDDTSHYEGALLEDIQHKFAAIIEGQQPMASVPAAITQLKEDMGQLRQDVGIIKAVVTEHSNEFKGIDKRVTKLELAIA